MGRALSIEPGAIAALCIGLLRYIEMNPVRANIVKHPGDYRWSSYAANAEGQKVEWLTPHVEYLALAEEESKRLAAYRGLFATDLDPEIMREIRISTHGGYAIGGSRFREEIEITLNRRAAPHSAGRPGNCARIVKLN